MNPRELVLLERIAKALESIARGGIRVRIEQRSVEQKTGDEQNND